MRLFTTLLILPLIFGISCVAHKGVSATENPNSSASELVAFGPYPDYYYNLANEWSNLGNSSKAMENYRLCIENGQNRAIVEDAMFNLSLHYFEANQLPEAYALFDSLLALKYTWLGWYKDQEGAFATSPDYQQRLAQVDVLAAAKRDPANCTFHFEDIDRFVQTFELSSQDWEHAPDYFYNGYFSQASKGLFFFQKFKIRSSSHLFAYRIEEKQGYYRSILPNLQAVKSQEPQLRTYLSRFQEIYPEAVFPDVYFVVGCFNAGGTSSPFGLLIGTEMHSRQPDSPLDNFNNWEKSVVKGFENLPVITLHELVHIQQNDNYTDLLGNAIYEGAADFVCELICGSHINTLTHAWANQHEAEVKADFLKEMHNEYAGDWIGNGDRARDKPADLGYYMGYQICKAYYNKQADKQQAIKDILTISDWEDFYQKSGY